jgi:hypothetical protein
MGGLVGLVVRPSDSSLGGSGGELSDCGGKRCCKFADRGDDGTGRRVSDFLRMPPMKPGTAAKGPGAPVGGWVMGGPDGGFGEAPGGGGAGGGAGGAGGGCAELAAPAPALAAAGAPAKIIPAFMRRKRIAPRIAAAPAIEPTAIPALPPGDNVPGLVER